MTDKTSRRFLLGQRPEDGFLYNDVLSGILEDLVDVYLNVLVYPQDSFFVYPFVFPPLLENESLGSGESQRDNAICNKTQEKRNYW